MFVLVSCCYPQIDSSKYTGVQCSVDYVVSSKVSTNGGPVSSVNGV